MGEFPLLGLELFLSVLGKVTVTNTVDRYSSSKQLEADMVGAYVGDHYLEIMRPQRPWAL